MGSTLAQMTYSEWRPLFPKASLALRLKEVITAHGPRPGWATGELLNGVPFPTIQEGGRWASPTNLRIYLDVVAAAAQRASSEATGWASLAAEVNKDFWRFPPRWW